jgi:16S rRNA (guanine1207-N2)-methyltransferase
MTQYFDDEPSVASDPIEVVWSLPDGSLPLLTDHGVFGYGRVDTGTKLLLLTAPVAPLTGNLLDLGCGTGAIAITMARRSPDATIWAVDVNRRARELCATNIARNGVTNVRVATPDEVPSDLRFDQIWSNPPIRIGKPALHELLLRWTSRLTPGGEALLVVHKHLGADSLQRWLVEQGLRTERLSTGAGFRVLRVTVPG